MSILGEFWLSSVRYKGIKASFKIMTEMISTCTCQPDPIVY